MLYSEEYKLCYIENHRAYFTTQALDKQWGDDWNDAPYDCNAGTPNVYKEEIWDVKSRSLKPNPEPRYDVAYVFFDGDFDEPADRHFRSPYSVEDINRRVVVPWLTTGQVDIWAGTSYPEFVRLIQSANGDVYEPITRRDSNSGANSAGE